VRDNQAVISCASIRLHQMRSGTVIAVVFGHAFIAKMIALQLAKDRRPAAL
jgi:hypothetical protein